MTEKNNIYIEDVVDVKELQTLQDNWAKATDLAFVTVDCNGTPITKQSNFTPFCKRLRELDAFREKCYYCDACGGRKARRIGKAYVYICHAGLIDFAIPIMIKGQYVGAFLAGQVTSTDFADLKKITTQSEDWKDNQELVERWQQYGEAYAIGANKDGMPIFKDRKAAIKQAKKDYGLGFEYVAQIICDSYNYSVEREYANKVNAELREKDYKLMKEEKLRIEMEKSLRDIELKALHYQINPHFLFNVLNTIGRLAFFENAKMTEDVVYAFADMMRYILRKSRDPLSPLREELTHVQNYLKIQKIRLGSRLQYSINISEAYYSVKLPFLSLTTLVENSIKYAVENKASGGMVEVNGIEKDGDLCIDIIDNGDGMSQSKIVSVLRGDAYKDNEKGSVGLYNINSRLIHYFGNEYALSIESENKPSLGTKVTIKVPLVQE